MREIKGNLEGSSKEYLIDIYNDISELANVVERAERKSSRDNSSEDTSSSDTNSLEEAFHFLKYGSDKFYKNIIKEQKKLNVDNLLGNVMNKQKYEKRVYGFVPDIPNYLIGNPLNMINIEKTELSHKVVNIFLNTCYPWHIKSEDVNQCGTVYLTVLDLLEKAGYRVNLYVGVATDLDDNFYYMLMKAKTDKEPMNMKKMCFPIASSSMLRRIYFKWAESCNSKKDATRHGYGQYDRKTHIKNFLEEHLKTDFIVWEFVNADGKVKVEDVLEQLKKQGIKLDI